MPTRFDPFRELTRVLGALAPLQRDPRLALLSPGAEAGHTLERLMLGDSRRPIPALWFRPKRASGATVVYVHGAGTADILPNAPLFETLLARGMNVLAFDLDGFGANPAELRYPDCLDCLPRVLAAVPELPGVDAERVGIYGLSLGAAFTLLAAPLAPWLKAMVLFGTPLELVVSDWDRTRELLGTFHPLAAPVLLDAPTGHVARCFFEPIRFADGGRYTLFDREFATRIDALVRKLDPLQAAAACPSIPTRVLYGEWDAVVPPEAVMRLREQLKGETDLVTFPARNHTTLLYDRRAAEAAADWFEQRL